MNQFCLILKTAREAKGLSQKDLADNINIERNTYSTYETGKREPKLEILAKLVKELNIGQQLINLWMGQNVPIEINSGISVPGPDADLKQLVASLRELQVAAAEVQERIYQLVPLKKGSLNNETLLNQDDKDNKSKGGKSDKDG